MEFTEKEKKYLARLEGNAPTKVRSMVVFGSVLLAGIGGAFGFCFATRKGFISRETIISASGALVTWCYAITMWAQQSERKTTHCIMKKLQDRIRELENKNG